MKYALLIGDGMSDRPLRALGGRTPLQTARKPFMDRISSAGVLGLINNYAGKKFGMNSDVCIMNLLGYNPALFYTGRGPLEAASMGVGLSEGQIAFRCNLVTVGGGLLLDYSAGHISTREAGELIESLNECFAGRGITFYAGMSYRHIAVADIGHPYFKGAGVEKTACYPPHEIVNSRLDRVFPRGAGGRILSDIMCESAEVLESHEVNYVRKELDENPANMAWLWGQGYSPRFRPFPVRGAAISAVDVVKGIAINAGIKTVSVPGATGYFDTDYEAKGREAVNLLDEYDFVLVHLEAPDEAGHTGKLNEKIAAIEKFDSKIVGPVLGRLEKEGEFRLAVMPDHATPLGIKKHACDPVPFALAGAGADKASGLPFDEKSAKSTGVYINEGHKFMDYFLGDDSEIRNLQ